MSRYRFIAAERGHYPVRRLCQVLDVPASGFYAWQAAQRAVGRPKTPTWETALVQVFSVHKRRYGTRRLRAALREKGHRVGRQRLRTAMRRRGLHALQPKAFTPRTTDSTHGLRCAPNRLLDQPTPTQANRVWGSDTPYLPLANGSWAYWCAFQDPCTKHVVGRHVVGRHVGDTMPGVLVTTALQRAFFSQPPTPGSTAATRTAPCCTRTGPCARRAGAATATTTRKPKAAGPASKPRCSKGASGLFLPTWPTRKPAPLRSCLS